VQPCLTLIDLFCGAGGLSLGFANAGYDVICAADNNSAAVETYRANLGPHVAAYDLSEKIDLPTPMVVAGGPPCQGFSSAGLRKSRDTRNTLVGSFARTVAALRPSAFVFENVEGFLTSEDGAYVLDLLTPLIDAGYRIHLRKINAANYGVPQHRKRVIAIGGLGWDPTFPQPTHSAFGAPGAALATSYMPETPTLMNALEGLPSPATIKPGRPSSHFYRPLHGIDLTRARALAPGQTMRDIPDNLWHESFKKRAFRRVKDGTPTERRGGAPFGVRRLLPDQPCKAITGGALSDFIHPYEDRNLTVRELARIQTFPDEFTFVGTTAQQAQLIGNAVPPLLASTIAINLARDLRAVQPIEREGALLSFIPTLSTGMSPALSLVTNRIRATFGNKPKAIGYETTNYDDPQSLQQLSLLLDR